MYVVYTFWYTGGMKKPATFRLSDEARAMLDALASLRGLTHTAMLEVLIRQVYEQEQHSRRKQDARTRPLEPAKPAGG
jgi:hypothetical protein